MDMLDYPFAVFGVRILVAHGRICALQATLSAFPSKRAFRAATPYRLARQAETEVRYAARTCQHVLRVVWRLDLRLRPRRASLGSEISLPNGYETGETRVILHAHTESSTRIHLAVLENHQ